jgi:hypothetical protein
VKGTGFSPYILMLTGDLALATEGMYAEKKNLPQGLKPSVIVAADVRAKQAVE